MFFPSEPSTHRTNVSADADALEENVSGTNFDSPSVEVTVAITEPADWKAAAAPRSLGVIVATDGLLDTADSKDTLKLLAANRSE
jgi:hypothetical protein